jgi:hypothetical protein|nr:MAG TPA: HOLLIDAY JUNCTION RESOLVASE [Caudoviricetes sp.]
MSKIYVGIDNGISGTIGIVGEGIDPVFVKTPVMKEQDYTKDKKIITRLDYSKFMELFSGLNKNDVCVVMERAMVNPQRFVATASALRCHEAELIMIELLGCKHMFIDSKEWQKAMLPKGCSGEELKKASLDIGNRLFPQFEEVKHPDRDGLLIAEYARRKNL